VTPDQAARIVQERIENPVLPADPRPFWKRLLASLRLTGKVKKDGSAEVHMSGGADF
jgi:hypothetical protein